jgi:PPOX class probable F420-dependent enzyme
MATLSDPAVSELLEKPNHVVLSTLNQDGTVHTTIIWVNVEGDALAFNSARGRHWPSNLERDPRATLTLLNEANPYEYVEIKGSVEEVGEGADEHMDVLAKKYINQDTYPWRQPGEERVKFHLVPKRVRHVKA